MYVFLYLLLLVKFVFDRNNEFEVRRIYLVEMKGIVNNNDYFILDVLDILIIYFFIWKFVCID